MEAFRSLLDETRSQLAGWRVMSDLIPFECHQERKRLKHNIQGCEVSEIFNGTEHLRETPAIVLRFVDEHWETHLICFRLLPNSLTGEELAHQTVSVLHMECQVSSSALIATMRDRAAVNNAT